MYVINTKKGADLAHPLLGSRKAWPNKESRGFLSQKGLKLFATTAVFHTNIISKKNVFIFCLFSQETNLTYKILTK